MNSFPVNSDDEDGEGEKDEDTQWRMERHKREQWLSEQKMVGSQEYAYSIILGPK